MAKFYEDLVQGTPEWKKARAGIPTASHFSEIITPATMQLSASADLYENHCVAEIMLGAPIEDFGGSAWTRRGNELEPDAMLFYEMVTGEAVRHVGFITNDEGTFGASPDGIIGAVRGVELKCPKLATHIGYLVGKLDKKTKIRSTQGAYVDYKCQVQGNLFASGFEFWDVMSYHPEVMMKSKPFVRIPRDEPFLKTLSELLDQFHQNVQDKLEILRKGDDIAKKSDADEAAANAGGA